MRIAGELLLILIGVLCFAGRWSASAVVLDVSAVGMTSAIGALAVAAWLSRRPPRRRIHAAVSVVALFLFTLLAWHRWGESVTEDVTFEGPEGTLAGSLVIPRGTGPFPGIVFIHGSGPETRREWMFFARFMASRGIAALAYDKRGTGASEGTTYGTGYRGYAADALAALSRLEEDDRVDGGRTGLSGFSEGAWVVPVAAASSDAVDFVVVWGVAMSSPADQVGEEIALRLVRKGLSEREVQEAMVLHEAVMDYQRTGEGGDSLASALRLAKSRSWFDAAEDFPDTVYPFGEYSWWTSVMDFDPEPFWRRLHVPVMAIKGAEDDRSNAERVQTQLTEALRGRADPYSRIEVVPGADHMLLTWPLGRNVPPPVFADSFPGVIADWILRLPTGDGEGGP